MLDTNWPAHVASIGPVGVHLTREARVAVSAKAWWDTASAAVSNCSVACGESDVRAAATDAKPLIEVSGSRSVGNVIALPSRSRRLFWYCTMVRRRSVGE